MMINLLSNLSLNQINSLIAFLYSYGVVISIIGAILMSSTFINKTLIEKAILSITLIVEILFIFFIGTDNISDVVLVISMKTVCLIGLMAYSIQLKNIKSFFVLGVSFILIMSMSFEPVIYHSLGKINSKELTNQYVLLISRELVANQILIKSRFEVYNKSDDSKVKVLHSTEDYSVFTILKKIERDSSFWQNNEKFISITDIKD